MNIPKDRMIQEATPAQVAAQHAANVDYWERAYTGRGPLPGSMNRMDALDRMQSARKAQQVHLEKNPNLSTAQFQQ